MDARDVYNLYEAYRSVYAEQEALNEDVDYDLDEGYKKLPIASMLKQASRHGENVGRSGGDQESSLKRAKRVGRMMSAAERHDPVKSQGRAWANFGRANARQQNEELDLYDVVLEHLLDEGYCDDVESAEIIMANMSEEWLDGILDEAVIGAKKGTIRSVIEKGGKSIKYVQSGGDIVAGDRSADLRASASEGKRYLTNAKNERRVDIANSRSIKRLNAKPNSGEADEDGRWHLRPDEKTSYYHEVPTDYRARRRRASGR